MRVEHELTRGSRAVVFFSDRISSPGSFVCGLYTRVVSSFRLRPGVFTVEMASNEIKTHTHTKTHEMITGYGFVSAYHNNILRVSYVPIIIQAPPFPRLAGLVRTRVCAPLWYANLTTRSPPQPGTGLSSAFSAPPLARSQTSRSPRSSSLSPPPPPACVVPLIHTQALGVRFGKIKKETRIKKPRNSR